MKNIKIVIENELVYLRIISYLEENNITYIATYKEGDTLFPSVNQAQFLGQVEIDEEYKNVVKELLEGVKYEISPVITMSKVIPRATFINQKLYTFIFALTCYSTIMTLVAIRYWYINSSLNEDKNHVYEWNPNATILYVRNKHTKELIQVSHDENYDHNFERMDVWVRGSKRLEQIDADENGFAEKIVFFNINGVSREVILDIDEDGFIDNNYSLLENGDTLFYDDKNRNLMIESFRLKKKGSTKDVMLCCW